MKKLLIDFLLVTQIRASLNHHKKMKAEHSLLIPQKLTANLEL